MAPRGTSSWPRRPSSGRGSTMRAGGPWTRAPPPRRGPRRPDPAPPARAPPPLAAPEEPRPGPPGAVDPRRPLHVPLRGLDRPVRAPGPGSVGAAGLHAGPPAGRAPRGVGRRTPRTRGANLPNAGRVPNGGGERRDRRVAPPPGPRLRARARLRLPGEPDGGTRAAGTPARTDAQAREHGPTRRGSRRPRRDGRAPGERLRDPAHATGRPRAQPRRLGSGRGPPRRLAHESATHAFPRDHRGRPRAVPLGTPRTGRNPAALHRGEVGDRGLPPGPLRRSDLVPGLLREEPVLPLSDGLRVKGDEEVRAVPAGLW